LQDFHKFKIIIIRNKSIFNCS